jgi:hypothetical protein
VRAHAPTVERCTQTRPKEGGARTCTYGREVHTNAPKGGRCAQTRPKKRGAGARTCTHGREVHANAAKKGSSHARVQRKEVHSFIGRKCTCKHWEEGSAHTCSQRREVDTTRPEDGSECKRNHKREGRARTCTQSRELHAYAPRKHKSAMRQECSSIYPTRTVPQGMRCNFVSRGKRCSTYPKGGDSTYVQRKEVQLVSKWRRWTEMQPEKWDAHIHAHELAQLTCKAHSHVQRGGAVHMCFKEKGALHGITQRK